MVENLFLWAMIFYCLPKIFNIVQQPLIVLYKKGRNRQLSNQLVLQFRPFECENPLFSHFFKF